MKLFAKHTLYTLLFLLTKGQVLFDDMGERKRSVELALFYMRNDLQEFSQGIERMVVKKLEGIENIIEAVALIDTKDFYEKEKYLRDTTLNILEKILVSFICTVSALAKCWWYCSIRRQDSPQRLLCLR